MTTVLYRQADKSDVPAILKRQMRETPVLKVYLDFSGKLKTEALAGSTRIKNTH